MTALTVEQLSYVMPRADVGAWLAPLNQAAAAYGIDAAVRREAAWLANIAHESRELTALEESFAYTPARLVFVFPRHFRDLVDAEDVAARGPKAIAERVYGGRNGNGPEGAGDGWRFRARGPLGLTFTNNYRACSLALCGDDSLLRQPELLVDPEFGAASAGWYWERAGCNRYADADDFDGVCDAINLGRKTIARGDSNGFADRTHYWDRAREALNVEGGGT